jgi:hypothetical protein
MAHPDPYAQYVIQIEGSIDESLAGWLGPVDIVRVVEDSGRTVTTLSGITTDQAGLVGFIRYLHGLGMGLLSIERVTPRQLRRSE